MMQTEWIFLAQCGWVEGVRASPLSYYSEAWLWFQHLAKVSSYLKLEQLLVQGISGHTQLNIK